MTPNKFGFYFGPNMHAMKLAEELQITGRFELSDRLLAEVAENIYQWLNREKSNAETD